MIKSFSPIFSSLFIILSSTIMMTQPSYARPDLTTPIDMSLLHDSTSSYHFVTQQFSAPAPTAVTKGDEEYAKPRHYQVWLGIPKSLRSNPSQSQSKQSSTSVIYMLDGNGVLDDLDSTQLAALTKSAARSSGQASAPVLVFIGYQTPYRFDVAARAYDYTPPLLSKINEADKSGIDNLAMTQAFKEHNRERLNGGAEVFYQQLQNKIKPWVDAQLGFTANNQALWGHSYGGLFVLYTLIHHPEAFERYYSVDPSLWWQDGEIIKQYKIEKQKLSALDTTPYVRMTFSSSTVRQANSNTKEDFAKLLCNDWQMLDNPNLGTEAVNSKNNVACSYQLYQQSHGQLFKTGMQDMFADF